MFDFLLSTPAILLVVPFVLGATTEGGVLGKTRGKVGNVVFSDWKGINTIRAYTKPANPQTQPQQDNRSVFGELAQIGSDLNVPLLQDFWGGYGDKESAFNSFVRINKNQQGSSLDLLGLQIMPGTLSTLPNLSASLNTAEDGFDLSWNDPGGDESNMQVTVVAIGTPDGAADGDVQVFKDVAAANTGTASIVTGDAAHILYAFVTDPTAGSLADKSGQCPSPPFVEA